jgi:autotransporter-associated beta strand protein
LVKSGGATLSLTPGSLITTTTVSGSNVISPNLGVTGTTITSGSSTISVSSTTGLQVGAAISGTGIPGGATITSIGTGVITISSNATANGTGVALTATSTVGFTVGQVVNGTNIPVGATITAIGPNGLTISVNATAAGTNSLTYSGNNTYSGGTFVQGGTLSLNGLIGSAVIPGDLTINNATVTEANNIAGQINSASNVTINGGGVLTLVGGNTLKALNFNDIGGGGNPTVNINTMTISTVANGTNVVTVPYTTGLVVGQGVSGTGISAGTTITAINGNNVTLSAVATAGTNTLTYNGVLTLSAANAINAASDNNGTIPLIQTGSLILSNSAPVINVSGSAIDGLLISGPILSAGGIIAKTGSGNLVLSGASTFTNGFDLLAGAITFGANSTGGPVTSGPLGTGTFVIDGGTIQSDGTARTIGNAVTVNGDFTFGGGLAGSSVTLTGAINLGNATHTITVTNTVVNDLLSGVVSGSAGFTKSGNGILTLAGADTYAGVTTVSGGHAGAPIRRGAGRFGWLVPEWHCGHRWWLLAVGHLDSFKLHLYWRDADHQRPGWRSERWRFAQRLWQ